MLGRSRSMCCDSFRWSVKGLSQHIHESILPKVPPSRLPHNTEQRPLCCSGRPYRWPIFNIAVCTVAWMPLMPSGRCGAGKALSWGFPGGSMVKNLPAKQETLMAGVGSLGQEDPLEEEMATHSSILAWKIPWTEEPGGLQSVGWQRVGLGWVQATTVAWMLLMPSFPNLICNEDDNRA